MEKDGDADGVNQQEEFDRVFAINTRGQFFVAREAYRHLNENGRIILMSSNTAKDYTVPKHSLYSGSKGAIDSFVRVFSKDCGDKKITVNAVAPGGTVTDMFHDVSEHYIPDGAKYSAEERQQVCSPFCFHPSFWSWDPGNDVCVIRMHMYTCLCRSSFSNGWRASADPPNRWRLSPPPCTATVSPPTLRASSSSWRARKDSGLTGRSSRLMVGRRKGCD